MNSILADQTRLEKESRKFVKWARRAGKYNLISCSSGNMSHRLDENTILVSQSRCWLNNLKVKNVVVVNSSDGEVMSGNKPTGELPMHLAVLNTVSDINTVLHFQSPAATALACLKEEPANYNIIIEMPIYIGQVIHIPFIMPGSAELGAAVAEAFNTAGIVQLQNHGQVVIGKNYRDAMQKAVFFELACSILISNKSDILPIPDDCLPKLCKYR
jgi:ribulose-5-phosphate 4-epimerase/fuculose-1-phosphate aldolase